MINFEEHISNLRAHIQGEVDIADFELERISKVSKVVALKKKGFLIEPGNVSNHMNFISSGCMRAYFVDLEGQEHTLQFGIENWWINDLSAYITEQPAKMYVQALDPSVIVQIPKVDFDQLLREVPSISNFFRGKIQNGYVALQERTLENMSSHSFERYSAFLKKYKSIEQRLPQYVIASYLGITPEFLSYLKKKHAKDLS